MSAARHPLAAAVRSGKPAYGTFVMEFASRALPWLARQADLDFLMFDCEHGNLSRREVRDGVLACRSLGITPIVRVRAATRTEISPMLDMGAQAVIVPMAESAAQMQEAIEVAKYHPDGSRGAAFGLSHDFYRGDLPAEEVMAAANEDVMVIPLIETVAGVEAADEICALPGIEIAWVGPVDLTQSLGKPCDFADQGYLDAMDQIVAAAQRHGVAPGLLVNSVEGGVTWHRGGYRVFALSADLWLLRERLNEMSSGLREAIEAESES